MKEIDYAVEQFRGGKLTRKEAKNDIENILLKFTPPDTTKNDLSKYKAWL